jgi:hypothetical protein
VNWRAEPEGQALRAVWGLPPVAFDLLIETLVRICDDPYDRLFSKPLAGDPHERLAELGDGGFIEFAVDEAHGLIHMYRLVWIG